MIKKWLFTGVFSLFALITVQAQAFWVLNGDTIHAEIVGDEKKVYASTLDTIELFYKTAGGKVLPIDSVIIVRVLKHTKDSETINANISVRNGIILSHLPGYAFGRIESIEVCLFEYISEGSKKIQLGNAHKRSFTIFINN